MKGNIPIEIIETFVFNEAVNSDTLTSARFRKIDYSKTSNEFLSSSVRDSLSLTALMVLECLHGLCTYTLSDEQVNVGRGDSYLE